MLATQEARLRLFVGQADPGQGRAIAAWLDPRSHVAIGVATMWELARDERWQLAWVERDGMIDGVSVVTPCRTWFIEAATQASADMLMSAALRKKPYKMTTSGRGKQMLRRRLELRPGIITEDDQLAMVCAFPSGRIEGRWATRADLPALVNHRDPYDSEPRAAYPIDWVKRIARRSVAVLHRDGQLVSVVQRRGQTDRFASIAGTYTIPPKRHAGLEDLLTGFVVDELRLVGRATHVMVDADDTSGLALYHRVGFEPVGEIYTAYLRR